MIKGPPIERVYESFRVNKIISKIGFEKSL